MDVCALNRWIRAQIDDVGAFDVTPKNYHRVSHNDCARHCARMSTPKSIPTIGVEVRCGVLRVTARVHAGRGGGAVESSL